MSPPTEPTLDFLRAGWGLGDAGTGGGLMETSMLLFLEVAPALGRRPIPTESTLVRRSTEGEVGATSEALLARRLRSICRGSTRRTRSEGINASHLRKTLRHTLATRLLFLFLLWLFVFLLLHWGCDFSLGLVVSLDWFIGNRSFSLEKGLLLLGMPLFRLEKRPLFLDLLLFSCLLCLNFLVQIFNFSISMGSTQSRQVLLRGLLLISRFLLGICSRLRHRGSSRNLLQSLLKLSRVLSFRLHFWRRCFQSRCFSGTFLDRFVQDRLGGLRRRLPSRRAGTPWASGDRHG
ncbi:hypothetical protein OE88DRAFT_1437258 [Heliocybe sulcata]|uniref:Transmembrane protein n=1 Tax=Heliocybe sulcata TaxID=5364 RepID=A0A5C3N9P1_9AGAM|nr:hypothetical protein OE88DRAFT_1437258 [Heliocybe sulcata]